MSYKDLNVYENYNIRKNKDFIQKAKLKGFVEVSTLECLEKLITWIKELKIFYIFGQLMNGKYRIVFEKNR